MGQRIGVAVAMILTFFAIGCSGGGSKGAEDHTLPASVVISNSVPAHGAGSVPQYKTEDWFQLIKSEEQLKSDSTKAIATPVLEKPLSEARETSLIGWFKNIFNKKKKTGPIPAEQLQVTKQKLLHNIEASLPTPPTVVATELNGSILKITFNHPMDSLTIDGTSNFILKGPGGVIVEGNFKLINPTVALYWPFDVLLSDAQYYATVTTGVKDSAGMSFAEPYNFSVTHKTMEPPTVLSSKCTNGVFDVTFSDPMDSSTIDSTSFVLKGPGDVIVPGDIQWTHNNEISIIPNQLIYDQYSVSISTAVKNIWGVNLAAPYNFSFDSVYQSNSNTNPLTGQGYDSDTADKIFSNGAYWRRVYRDNGLCSDRFWSQNAVSIDDRLADCQLLRTNLIWRRHDGTYVLYDSWTPQQKARFNEYFQALWNDTLPGGVGCDNASLFMVGNSTKIHFNEQQAFDFYARQAAWSLIMEIKEVVPWSIIILPSNELGHLLSSAHYLTSDGGDGYTLHNGDYNSDSMVCDPRVSYLFFSGQVSTTHRNMIKSTEGETMREITRWFTNNVQHKTNSIVNQEVISNRAYIEDRLRAGSDDGNPPSPLVAVYVNYGCHSGARLFEDVARGLNIPVLSATFGGHAGLAWRWERWHSKICWHADDLYLTYAADASNYMYKADIGDYVSDSYGKDRIIFDTLWLGLDEMRAWGFHLGAIFDPMPPLTAFSEGEPEGGSWLSFDDESNEHFRFKLEKDMSTCGWNLWLHYCRLNDSDTWLDTGFSMDRTPSTRPVTRSVEEVNSRAYKCEQLHGGCSNWEAIESAWFFNIGKNPFPIF